MSNQTYDPAHHYDRITEAWTLLLGQDLHYGVFDGGETEYLAHATHRLTELMAEAARMEKDDEVLDVGCGTGSAACYLVADHGVRVTGISTSAVGIESATRRAASRGLGDRATFLVRDGMDTGFADSSFDRVWVLESSHLMRDRDRLVAECARLLRPGGRLVLCDIMLKRVMNFDEVRRLRGPLSLLRRVFGDARMEPLHRYQEMAGRVGLLPDDAIDLTSRTLPTFDHWSVNAERYREQVTALLGEDGLREFVESCTVLRGLWQDGTLGYGLFSAVRPER